LPVGGTKKFLLTRDVISSVGFISGQAINVEVIVLI